MENIVKQSALFVTSQSTHVSIDAAGDVQSSSCDNLLMSCIGCMQCKHVSCMCCMACVQCRHV